MVQRPKPLGGRARGIPPAAWLGTAVLMALGLCSAAAAAQPETLGPYQVQAWTDPPGAPVPCPAGIFYPADAPCAGAPVVLVHGGGESGAYKVRMGELMASRGLVAIVPSFPSRLIVPTVAEGERINELLEWAVQQAQDPATPIHGKIDASAYGVAGHSNGGVAYVAAASNPKIQAIIGWDAVAHLSYAAGFHGASLHLLADGDHCGGGSREAYDLAPEPKVLATVTDSSHCDFNDPASPLCVPFCGTPPWSPEAAAMIERYSVAWFTCLLGHDPTMAGHLDFASPLPGLEAVEQLGTFSCQPADCGAAGSGGAGGSGTAGSGAVGGSAVGGSAAGGSSAGGSTAGGSGAVGGSGAAGGGGTGGTPPPGAQPEDESGCGCRVPGGASSQTSACALALLGLALVVAKRRRRKCAE